MLGRSAQGFERVEQASGVAVGVGNQAVYGGLLKRRYSAMGQRPGHDLGQILRGQGLQNIDRCARQQG